MSPTMQAIADIIEIAAPSVPVIFQGSVPRRIGTLGSAPSAAAVQPIVDALLISQGLSAEKISVGVHEGRRFVMVYN